MAVKKFLKFDSEKGYLDNKDDINYFATSQMRKVAFGKMLGDFDENGLYVINSKIVEELIKMPKVIVEMVDGADLVRSKVKADAFFHFILTVEDNKASLKLLEKIHYQSNRDFNSGLYSNINEYVLDEVIVPDKDFDRNALYQKYNISTENDGEVLSIFDMDELSLALYYNIIEKLKIDYLIQNELIIKEKELESIEADYFESMLAVLAEFDEVGKKVTTSLKKDLAEKHNFMIISKPFFQHAINEVLDSYINQYIQDLSPEQKEQFLVKIREIKSNYYQKFKALLPIEIAQKAGVRFDANQIIEEGIIGGLAKEISTKGFTSSDVRRLKLDESQLQLSIAKIKEILKENEEICKRDNAKANDITKGRELTTKFYNELEKENKVDMLKPDTSLITAKINENTSSNKAEKSATAGVGDAKKVETAKKPETKKSEAKKTTAAKKPAKSAGPAKSGGAQKKKDDKKKESAKSNTTSSNGQGTKQTEKSKLPIYGSGRTYNNKDKNEDVLDNILDDALLADRFRSGKGAGVDDGLSLR